MNFDLNGSFFKLCIIDEKINNVFKVQITQSLCDLVDNTSSKKQMKLLKRQPH